MTGFTRHDVSPPVTPILLRFNLFLRVLALLTDLFLRVLALLTEMVSCRRYQT